MKYLILVLILFQGCVNLPYTGNAGSGEDQEMYCDETKAFSTKVVHCLMSFVTGGDAGGTWVVSIKPIVSTIQVRLIGSNPCIEWANEACGRYRFFYIVGDPCCRDTAIVNIKKCCVTATVNCN